MASEFLPNLGDYDVSSEEIDELKSLLNEIESSPSVINVATNARKAATREIKVLIAEARTILDTLDDAFEGLIDDQSFIDGWFAIRKIKGRHHSKKEMLIIPRMPHKSRILVIFQNRLVLQVVFY